MPFIVPQDGHHANGSMWVAKKSDAGMNDDPGDRQNRGGTEHRNARRIDPYEKI